MIQAGDIPILVQTAGRSWHWIAGADGVIASPQEAALNRACQEQKAS